MLLSTSLTHPIVIGAAILAAALVLVAWITAATCRWLRRAAYECELKALMIERGLGAAEIERVIRLSATRAAREPSGRSVRGPARRGWRRRAGGEN